jgi:hypothetical protein
MATISTLDPAVHGGTARGRQPYFVEASIDLAAAATAKGSALAANDIITCLNIPANTVILHAGAECTATPAGGTSDSFDLGVTGGDVDNFVDGFALTGSAAAGDYAPTPVAYAPVIVASADTLDMLLLGTTPSTSGTIRVFAILMDIDGHQSARTADEVDRDTLA